MTDALEYEKKIAQKSRRSASNEAGLLWSFSGVVIGSLIFVVWRKVPSIPVPFNLHIYVFSVSCGVIFGAVIALFYYRRVKVIAKRAAEENLAIMQRTRARQKEELNRKIAAMKAREAEKQA